MSRIATALALATALSACVADGGDQSLLILYNAEPGANCTINPDVDTFIARGLIDVNAGIGYLFTPIVENIVEEVEGSERRVYLTGANIDLTFLPGVFSDAEITSMAESGVTSFGQSFGVSAEPGGRVGLGFVILPVQVLDALAGKLAEGQSTEVTAHVSVVGDVNGREIESNDFAYPIEVCNGCLRISLGACTGLDPGFMPTDVGGTCQTFQDGLVQCCTSPDGQLICPAIPMEPPA